ncbi:MAG: histidine--tRNA ligase [Hyphomicrobiaceae bacterium]|nr:histidine--tRNA ligase [Hyphomicrobiaceae bacterium]
MAKKKNTDAAKRPEAHLPKGLRDIGPDELRENQAMLAKIRAVYERYGFEPLETPAFEYTEALGKFLPDQDRPNAGVFSFQEEDEQWVSLRYDLTAPLARYVAENFDKLPKPFRRYATGSVYRNEKPGPGRFRQFTQFDADTVGAESVAADAEMCMLAADTLEALGIPRGQYVVKVNNRKVLDGVMESVGLAGDGQAAKRMTVLRAIDKFDRLGDGGVRDLLGKGRKDESGDFTQGANLNDQAIETILKFVKYSVSYYEPTDSELGAGTGIYGRRKIADYQSNLNAWEKLVTDSETGKSGVQELRYMGTLFKSAGYADRIDITAEVVRGLEYYTGPVFEAELLIDAKDDSGQLVRFGSVGGGGRYDGLVERFLGTKVPATGFSIGVSRLQAALAAIGKTPAQTLGPVVILVMDKGELPSYQKMAQTLRSEGIRAEMYLGSSGMKAQMKYADKRSAPCVIIQGSDERAKGEVTIKDLIEGAKAAAAIKDNAEWKAARPAQMQVPEADLVKAVRDILARHTPDQGAA